MLNASFGAVGVLAVAAGTSVSLAQILEPLDDFGPKPRDPSPLVRDAADDPLPLDLVRILRSGQVETQANDGPPGTPGGLGAALARQTFGVDGSGVTIAVISDSFDALGGAAAGAAAGELPAVTVLNDDFDPLSTDEGRALIEIIHDVAPGADIIFHSAFNNPVTGLQEDSLAFAIDACVAAGADVIIDDIGFLFTPLFADGSASDAIERAELAGVTYVSAAGNAGSNATFDEISFTFDPNLSRDVFDRSLEIEVLPGRTATVLVQWAQTGQSSMISSIDIDAFLFDSATGQAVDASGFPQPAAIPVEAVQVTNQFSFVREYTVELRRFTGPNSGGVLRMVVLNGAISSTINTAGVELDPFSIFGHPLSDAAITVGFQNFDEPSVSLFSSIGAASSGVMKPDVTATGNANNSFFGRDTQADPDTAPNFPGSSPAAAAAAGVAALALELAERNGVDLPPGDLRRALACTSSNGQGSSMQDEFRDDSGFGLIEAVPLLAFVDRDTQSPVDFDGSGVVNISDLFAFISAFTAPPLGAPTTLPEGLCGRNVVDIDRDGTVNISDLFAYIELYLDTVN
ncbi:MAG: S8 family serine peptidase [Planctomycetota bacterium]